MINYISIIIPVYNVEKYFNECIESILNQTYKNYEIILIDDGSTDKSGEICDDYAKRYSFISVIHQENKGQAAARNIGVETAKSDWIMFIDSDDVAHPQLLEYLVTSLEESGAKISACHRLEGDTVPEYFFNKKDLNFKRIDINEESLLSLYKNDDSFYWALFPSLIFKEIYLKHKMPPGRIYEDNAVCCRWLYSAEIFAAIPDELYFYRKNPEGTMNSGFKLKRLDFLWAVSMQLEFFKSISYFEILNEVFKNYIGSTIWIFNEINKRLNDDKLGKKVLRESLECAALYKAFIVDYKKEIEPITKRLNPQMHKLKKRVKGLLKGANL